MSEEIEELKQELLKETLAKQQWYEAYIKEKEKNKELENADLTTVYMSGFYDGEKMLENKIKAKIEEYKIKCKDCKFDKYFCKQLNKSYLCSVRNIQKLLQELLEE